jgi:hypothetical protein
MNDSKSCEQCKYESMIVGLLVELGKIKASELTKESGITNYKNLEGE